MLQSFAVEIGTSTIPDWALNRKMFEVHTPTTNAGAVTINGQSWGPGCAGALAGESPAQAPSGTTGDWITITVRVS